MAQEGDFSMGARSTGMAGSSITIGDAWALFNNIGGLSYHTEQSAFISYQSKFGISELSSMAAGYVHPIWNGTAGIGFYRFGSAQLSEQKAQLGFSNQFGIVSLGLNVGVYQINIEGFGSNQSLIIDFGGQARLTEQLYFGAHVSNLNQAKLSKETGELVPTFMKTGLSYRPHENLMLNAEVEKSIDADAFLKIGLEYKIIDQVSIRTGIATNPFNSAFGVGFHPRKFIIDYSFQNDPTLGDVHELSIIYQVKK